MSDSVGVKYLKGNRGNELMRRYRPASPPNEMLALKGEEWEPGPWFIVS